MLANKQHDSMKIEKKLVPAEKMMKNQKFTEGSNCPACRLKKCVAIGMKMEGQITLLYFHVFNNILDVGMTRKCSRNVVGYIDGWETVKQIVISLIGDNHKGFKNNCITDLTAYGPKGIQCLMGAKTATEYATIYAHYGQ